ncbi:hypothetical protein CYLTODRAFT_293505 [Cylindrobasidium torrendii FP15055 ss-10]|uniref:DUF6699 domain-containing protein n=1 Tax=Cylindrobasidium torrendii FP15055 ss-10 TaxID=1314674 RepID=A0A0D7BA93_9AGAR|nr:hypothetical protein CYLTODRAFT_293505 [Cylindrobasidium torrendii FP15055 ss-10]
MVAWIPRSSVSEAVFSGNSIPLRLLVLGIVPMGSLYDLYNLHGNEYRQVRDLNHPWTPSPTSSVVVLPNEIYALPYDESWQPPRAEPLRLHIPKQNDKNTQRRGHRLLRRIRKAFKRDTGFETYEIPMYHPFELNPPMPRYAPVPFSEWKAYGYYASPVLNGVHVLNETPRLPPTSTPSTPEDLFEQLRSPGGTPHPERWIPGTRHPALPPRPSRWKRPDPSRPLPFPWELYLNPWLSHSDSSASRIRWNIGSFPDTIWMNLSSPVIPLATPDFRQPATYPFVSHLHINGLKVNGQPTKTWYTDIHNPDGIVALDVFWGIYNCFNKVVDIREYNAWEPHVRQEAHQVLQFRLRNNFPSRGEDVIRRRDYLGWNYLFDGLSVNGQGWTLHVVRSPQNA